VRGFSLGEIVIDITVDAGDPGYFAGMEEIARATKNLIETHGKNAARVAEQRSVNAELGGSRGAAHIWRQIASVIRQMQGSAHLTEPRSPRGVSFSS
jgi:hypothetical protein